MRTPQLLKATSLLLGAALSVLPTAPANAQQSATRAPLILAIADTLTTPDAQAIVMRSPGVGQTDVIVLRRNAATPALLGAAITKLEALRRAEPQPANLEVLTITHAEKPATIPSSLLAMLTATLDRVNAQPTARVGNLGVGRWLTLAGTR